LVKLSTPALSGGQHTPRSGTLLLFVRDDLLGPYDAFLTTSQLPSFAVKTNVESFKSIVCLR
jgi:hypothetical protein